MASRKPTCKTKELRVPAIRVRQGPKRTLYTFAIDGKELDSFAALSRVGRKQSGDLLGYQRPEVLSHIGEIRSYLESKDPLIPNALVIAFDKSVKFQPAKHEKKSSGSDYATPGTLVIPRPTGQAPTSRPGWIVDGQQRTAAIRQARLKKFPVCVTAFVAEDEQEQREQFILVNSTKPLPKGLIYELLPQTSTRLPSLLQRRRFPAYLMNRLNLDVDSPLRGRIQTPTTETGFIKDNSILKMLENSLTDGILYRFRDVGRAESDVESMLETLQQFWKAVAQVFAEAWDLPPRRSRLTHGAGVISLGFLMDAIGDRHRAQGVPTTEVFEKDLAPLADVCRWTNGYWDFGPGAQRKWNEIQNTSKDIQVLSNYLMGQYKARVWSQDVKR